MVGFASRAFCALALTCLTSLAYAQDPGGEPDPNQPPRATPRAAVVGYLTACREADFERAAEYLDLRRIDEGERAKAGPRLARQLKVVLDQTLWVDIDDLATDPAGQLEDGLRRWRDHVGAIDSEAGRVDVFVDSVPVGAGKREWKISASTLARVPALHDEFGFGPLAEYLPAFMFSQAGELKLWQIAGLFLLILVGYVLSSLAARLIERIAVGLTRRTETTLDDEVLTAVHAPLTFALLIGIINVGSLPLGLALPARNLMSSLSRAAMVVMFAWMALRLIDVAAHVLERNLKGRGETTVMTVIPVGRRIAKVALGAIAFLSILQNLGYNVISLLAGLGVAGIAVALAAQKTFENFFGALSILVDQPVRRGDFCRFGDKVGVIEDIGLRSTRIRTLDRTVVTVPNADFSSMELENFARRDQIRFTTVLGLRYETTAEQLRHVLVEIKRLLASHPRVSPDPARVRFVGFGSSSLDLEIFAYIETNAWDEFLAVREDLLLRLIDVVEASGSSFAFPSQTLYVAQDDGLDATRVSEAEAQVERWRREHQLPLPGFAEDELRSMRKSLPYPPPGSVDGPPHEGAPDAE